jgi:hypothetical protein
MRNVESTGLIRQFIGVTLVDAYVRDRPHTLARLTHKRFGPIYPIKDACGAAARSASPIL